MVIQPMSMVRRFGETGDVYRPENSGGNSVSGMPMRFNGYRPRYYVIYPSTHNQTHSPEAGNGGARWPDVSLMRMRAYWA